MIEAKQTPDLLSQINEKLDNLSLKLDEMRACLFQSDNLPNC